MDVLHTAIWVDDVEAMKAFYTEGLGLEYSREFVGDDGVTNYFLTGESDTELQFKYDEDEDESGGREVEPSGFDHTAIAVTEIDDTVDTLVAEYDGSVDQEPTTMDDMGVRISFVSDPDGYGVELIETLE
ncbi:VOC family protein [Halobacteria archaeon AArc-m2/3/4]|uniref:VOC family protein n=1 Tax=Natronoglomus mannanivorans TaxID=2979990 RepID=A0ABT2QDB5_9EURY|nr:VOC family protein [Halobacteria archaeon AArc-m2/3/4]